MELLRSNMTRWRNSITAGRCKDVEAEGLSMKQDAGGETPECAARSYLIEVNFDALANETERSHLKNLPTSFHLEPDDVDKLKEAARKILLDSLEFQNLVDDMQ